MKKFLSLLLIMTGILVFFIPSISNYIIKYNLNKNMGIIDELSYEDIQENQSRAGVFDFASIRDISMTTIMENNNKFDPKALMGYISIDDLNIHLPILKGVNDANLLAGIATMVEDQEMGKGNYPLAGHYSSGRDVLFGPLLDIQVDSMVRITDKDTIYEYRIYETRIVADTDLYIIEDTMADERGRPIISLMTCYYTSKNGKRFFALGELVDTYSYDKSLIES